MVFAANMIKCLAKTSGYEILYIAVCVISPSYDDEILQFYVNIYHDRITSHHRLCFILKARIEITRKDDRTILRRNVIVVKFHFKVISNVCSEIFSSSNEKYTMSKKMSAFRWGCF